MIPGFFILVVVVVVDLVLVLVKVLVLVPVLELVVVDAEVRPSVSQLLDGLFKCLATLPWGGPSARTAFVMARDLN